MALAASMMGGALAPTTASAALEDYSIVTTCRKQQGYPGL